MFSHLYLSWKSKMLLTVVAISLIINFVEAAPYPTAIISSPGSDSSDGSEAFDVVDYSSGLITCGSLQCPSESRKCSIWTTSSDDLKTLKTLTQCFGENDIVLSEDNTSALNPSGRITNNYSEFVNGNSIHCTDCNGTTPKEIKDDLLEQQLEFENEMKEWLNHFTHTMSKIVH